ncbi:uncharacterized protein EI90DRAFT_2438399 [Cantharellus anzutake]|uniref:uncharacterized protein n=1 Tax=Cantharellus anzutake TaxID=1750568 RepID=UPI0019070D9E|nr:uncharacterized protein EI90DRAFT_2438399 [Cantharellus anzutake]KAF8338975.1 hypothetical protein EI90DRAFT_2438399 [Cantharellus anzutake]
MMILVSKSYIIFMSLHLGRQSEKRRKQEKSSPLDRHESMGVDRRSEISYQVVEPPYFACFNYFPSRSHDTIKVRYRWSYVVFSTEVYQERYVGAAYRIIISPGGGKGVKSQQVDPAVRNIEGRSLLRVQTYCGRRKKEGIASRSLIRMTCTKRTMRSLHTKTMLNIANKEIDGF